MMSSTGASRSTLGRLDLERVVGVALYTPRSRHDDQVCTLPPWTAWTSGALSANRLEVLEWWKIIVIGRPI